MNDTIESETDDLAVGNFADAMKKKLRLARENRNQTNPSDPSGGYIINKHLGRIFSIAAVLCDGSGNGDGNGIEK